MWKKGKLTVLSLVLAIFVMGTTGAAIAGGHWDVYNQLVVTFEDDVTETRIDEINRSFGTEIISRIRNKTYHLRIAGNKPTATEIGRTSEQIVEMIKSYKELPEVQRASLVFMVQPYN